jgi:hypothetical protein
MRVTGTGHAFFFDVNDFSRAADVAITSDDTPAWQRRKPEKSNNAHGDLRFAG